MAIAIQNPVLGRFRLMRFFLWMSVLGWGLGLGGKLFDLLVVAGAWSASPPASLALLPYGPRYPMNPGDFFQPLSIVCPFFSLAHAHVRAVRECPSNGASPLAKIAVGLVRLDYSAEVVQHADLCLVRARERTVLRVRDRVTDRVWPCIPDRAISKPIAN